MFGVGSLGFSFDSCIVIISGLVVFARWESSVILFLIPFILIWRILRFLGLGGVCLDAELLWEELEDWEELVGDE